MNGKIEKGLARQAALLDVSLWTVAFGFYSAPSIALGHFTRPMIAYLTLCALIGVALCWSLYLLIRRTDGMATGRRAAIVGAGLAAVLAIHGVADTISYELLLGLNHKLSSTAKVTPWTFMLIYNILMLAAVYVLYVAGVAVALSLAALQARERSLAEAKAATQEAQLAALRMQVNPHFLFNVLNAVSSLIGARRNDQAQTMVSRLSSFFRASLSTTPNPLATLEDELDVVGSYLEIEEVRFGTRLAVDIRCEEGLGMALVPHFILQPLVENAIKHGVARTTRQVTLSIHAARRDGGLVLRVMDDAAAEGGPAPAGAGVGLGNISERLRTLFGPAGRLRTIVTERRFTVELSMPLAFAGEARRAA